MLEKMLIFHCAPTLAGIKTGNLFNYSFSSEETFYDELGEVNEKMNTKGIHLELLRIQGFNALILAYRPTYLARDLKQHGVGSFLEQFEHNKLNPDYAISKLKERISYRNEFPHEIGIFIGYPIDDIIGFIENRGQNCKCAGFWKVYRNEKEAVKKFHRYDKCRDVYSSMFFNGCPIMKLVVAV